MGRTALQAHRRLGSARDRAATNGNGNVNGAVNGNGNSNATPGSSPMRPLACRKHSGGPGGLAAGTADVGGALVQQSSSPRM